MSAALRVVGVGVMDEHGLVGSKRPPTEFGSEGLRGVKWKEQFALPNPAYRHLDLFGRCVALATEASGLAKLIPEDDRSSTALVLATDYGCLQSDLEFAESLQAGARIAPALFPYTLPSTCLGEVAIRHRLQGPLMCLMAGSAGEGSSASAGLVETKRLIDEGEARAAVLCLGDCLEEERAAALGLEARLAVAALVLMPESSGAESCIDWDVLSKERRPVEWLMAGLREEHSRG